MKFSFNHYHMWAILFNFLSSSSIASYLPRRILKQITNTISFHWVILEYLSLNYKVKSEVAQSCPTLCEPIDGLPPGSPVPGILQARTLEWVAISFSNAWKWKVKVKLLSCVRLLATSWTAAYQAPPSMGFSRQEY